ncbi:MAG: 6-carboxytetrahydropterin synthase [Rhodospirillales bacterium]|nr:6-carboxytetrahydropterin synthase [Rhodospirillales bacterium]
MEIAYEFGFDAAHHFLHQPEGHLYRRMHGHSFFVEVAIAGDPDPATGFVVDLAALEAASDELRRQLDHTLLNDVPGLEVPSLENIAIWTWERLAPQFSGLARVTVRRPSCRQSCVYRGYNQTRR